MKRFLTSAFFAASMAFSFACGPYWLDPVDLKALYNVTPSSIPDMNYYTSTYWTNYNQIGATEDDLNKLLAEGSNAIETSVNPIAKALRESGDKEDLEYFKLLCDYNAKGAGDAKKMREYDDWYYPTKEEYKNWGEAKSKLLKKIEEHAGGKLSDRYAYTAMKIYFDNLDLEGANSYIKSHKEDFEKLKKSPFYDMCRSLYAGILYRTGKDEKTAIEIYAEIGDTASLKYIGAFSDDVYEQLSLVWEENKNSPLIPYLLERAVAYPSSTDKYLCDFANTIALDSACKNPQMWKCAAAAIHSNPNSNAYDVSVALEEIQQALKLKGNTQSGQSARVLDFYIKSLNQSKWTKDFASYALGEYGWLSTLGEKGNNALAAITLEGIIPLLERSGKKSVAGLLSLRISQWEPNYILASKLDFHINRYIEIMDAEETEKMFQKPSASDSDKFTDWVYSSVDLPQKEKEIDEYIGTKYLREGDFSRAQDFFSKLEDSFCYQNRIYNVPRWFKSENIVNKYKFTTFSGEEVDLSSQLTAAQKKAIDEWSTVKNKKLRYCKDIQNLLSQYESAESSDSPERYELAYKIAILYDQASYSGYCWYLRQYERGSWRLPLPKSKENWHGEDGGELSLYYKNPFYFENQTQKYLTLAAQSPDSELSYMAKYALLFVSYDGESQKVPQAIKDELYQAQQNGLLSGEMATCDLLADYSDKNNWY